MSLATSFTMDEVPSVKSFMQVRIDSGPRIEPYDTPALFFSHSDVCLFRTTLLNLFDRKFLINSNKLPEIPKYLILNIKPGNQIWSHAIDVSKNSGRIYLW